MTSHPILIAGAGPTGLVLALGLARRGVPFRIISDAKGPGEHSRAMGVHARTLEFYAQFGFADEVVSAGIQAKAVHLREGSAAGRPREVMSMQFTELGEGISAFPYMLSYPQDQHERLLIGKLAEAGGRIEWNTGLAGFTQDEAGVTASLVHADGSSEQVVTPYLCGCDGAHSKTRETLATGFGGGTYEQLFYVADVKIEGAFQPDMFVTLGEHIVCLMMPVRSTGMQRLIGLVPPEFSDRRELSFEEIRPAVETLTGVRVTEVNWFSHYRVHHRVASNFNVGRVFLLGDAAHIHSPIAGQGMNTGIGDAINLGWKLAQVMQGRAPATLLDSYEPERITFARQLVNTTDRAFTAIISESLTGAFTRRILAPVLMGVANRFEGARHALFRTVSQTQIHYPDSALSEGKAGHVHGGDRLPWIRMEGTDNFAALRSLEWQVHVYGNCPDGLRAACAAHHLALQVYPWSAAAGEAGLVENTALLVRPDGYVALAGSSFDVASALVAYIAGRQLRFA